MHPIWLIVKKEWKESFNSVLPYVFLGAFFLLLGWFFTGTFFLYNQASLDQFFEPLPVILVFFMPAFTMRLFSEEFRSGTIESLATLPLSDINIVLGKYAAAVLFWGLTLGLSTVYVLLVGALGRPDYGQILAGFLGAFLLGAFYAAIGLFASALTKIQVVAYLLAMLVCFSAFIVGKASQYVGGPAGSLLSFLGVDVHYENFLRGVVDSRALVYFVSGPLLFLGGALAAFHSRRWR